MADRPDPLPLPVTERDEAERARRVDEIARRVRTGGYRVPAEEVAAAVIEFHRRVEA